MTLFAGTKVIEALALSITLAGLIAIVAYVARRKAMGKLILLPFLYSTTSFSIWLISRGAHLSLYDWIVGLVAINAAVGLMLSGALIEMRSKS